MGAGLGFKTFVTGDVLTATDTNGYLMQGVWVFADAAARDAAVTSPQEGNMCYLKSTDAVQSYSGSAWVAVGGGGGKVLQVKNFVYGTQTSSTSGTFADTGVTLSITPTLNTSKVLVLVNMQGVGRNSTNSSGVYLKLLRGATVIQQMGDTNGFTNSSSWTFDSVGSTYLDSPATTSATTYKVQFAQVSPVAGTVYVQEYQSVAGSAESSITLMEIGA